MARERGGAVSFSSENSNYIPRKSFITQPFISAGHFEDGCIVLFYYSKWTFLGCSCAYFILTAWPLTQPTFIDINYHISDHSWHCIAQVRPRLSKLLESFSSCWLTFHQKLHLSREPNKLSQCPVLANKNYAASISASAGNIQMDDVDKAVGCAAGHYHHVVLLCRTLSSWCTTL